MIEKISKYIEEQVGGVEYKELPNRIRGTFNKEHNKVCVSNVLEGEDLVKTLVHELVHFRLHKEQGDRCNEEFQAKEITSIVMRELGLKHDRILIEDIDILLHIGNTELNKKIIKEESVKLINELKEVVYGESKEIDNIPPLSI